MFTPSRLPKSNEKVKKTSSSVYYYIDAIVSEKNLHKKLNTYYETNYKRYEKEWAMLPDGRYVETHVHGMGYERWHFYDLHKNVLLYEYDNRGNKNLLHHRRAWNPEDNELSQELLGKFKPPKRKKSSELF